VEAAALRSLGLVTSLPLTALGNPLTRLLDEALDLSGIDQVLGRSPGPAPVRRSTGGRATSASRSPASSGQAGPGSATAAATTAVGTAARSAATALQRTAGQATASSGPGSAAPVAAGAPGAGSAARQATSSTTSRPRANPRPDGAQAPAGEPSDRSHGSNRSGSSPTAVPDLDPGELRAARATSTLRGAARSTNRSTRPSTNRSAAPTANPADGSRAGRTAPGSRVAANAGPASPSGPATGATSAPEPPRTAYRDAPAANLPVPLTPDFSRGGLAELVARWQDGEPSRPGSDASPASTEEFTPAFTTAPERERPLRLGDEDRVELALEQILRREVERHGLEGGR
jgi:hypothetical protein